MKIFWFIVLWTAQLLQLPYFILSWKSQPSFIVKFSASLVILIITILLYFTMRNSKTVNAQIVIKI